VRALVFLDLDDTLFQSRRKCPSEGGLHPVAYLRDGRSHAFMTAKQQALWRLLDANATLIPTTARDLDALRRVDLPFRSWSIIAYGGIILTPEGRPHEPWLERMRKVSDDAIGELRLLLGAAEDLIARDALAARVRIVGDFDLPFYLVAKYEDGKEGDLDLLQRELIQPLTQARRDRFRLHRNGNNLAVLPRALGKEHAVRYLAERLRQDWGELITVGIGDSLVDGAFMAECDYAVTPRGSQLFAETLGRPLV
jgi:hydroxymethylpyrimidine pyrophosphatase-like HAD family hydrolase